MKRRPRFPRKEFVLRVRITEDERNTLRRVALTRGHASDSECLRALIREEDLRLEQKERSS